MNVPPKIDPPSIRVWLCPYCGRTETCPIPSYWTPNAKCYCQHVLICMQEVDLTRQSMLVKLQIEAVRSNKLVAWLARLLKAREWDDERGHCQSCGRGTVGNYDENGVQIESAHAPGCELAQALRAAGLEAKTEP